MKKMLANFNKYRPLLNELVIRDVKTKYRRSVLGVLWTLLNPLLMMVVLSVVFSRIFRFEVDNYPLYLLSGQVVFTFFSTSTTMAMSAILDNAPLIKKVYVPKYMFVLSRTVSSAINLMASLSALIIVMFCTRAQLHYTVLLSVFPVLSLIMFTFGVGMILATIAVKFRDIVHLYSVLTTALMYLTPVIYPLSELPDWVRRVVLINPLTSILEMFRGFVIYGTMPDLLTTLMTVVPSIIVILLGCRVFYKNQDNFILYV
mgnify:CR=1 FL=1